MKRLCVYLTYDKQRIIDRYIGYMLKELRSCMCRLVVVCNMPEVVCGEEILKEYADEIFYRENIGFDAGGFKEALCSFIGWEMLSTYDELVLANDSFFGPFRNMDSIFRDMDKRDCDFWGLTRHAYKKTEERTIPEHLQSYFLVIRSPMLWSEDFMCYWENMPYYYNFDDVVWNHEVVFTRYFSQLGYRHECLADMLPNDSEDSKNNYTQYGFLQYELISKRNFPFFKKKPVSFETLDIQTQENFKLALDYVEANTGYDVDMIWENLIRTMNMSDLQRNFHLKYSIPEKEAGVNTVQNKVALVIVAEHEKSVEYVLEYLERLENSLWIRIGSHKRTITDIYHKNGYSTFLIRGTDDLKRETAELSGCEYVCVLHDCDMSSDKEYSCTGKSLFYNSWHNLLAGKGYLYRLLKKFEKDRRLGVLMPPVPMFSKYFGRAVEEWDRHYSHIAGFIDNRHLCCPVLKRKMPFSVSRNMWIRGCVLKKAVEYGVLEKEYASWLWMYVAQSMGYYTGIVESSEYAAMNELNQQYYINRIVRQAGRLYGYGNGDILLNIQKQVFKGRLSEFCQKYEKIYVYGVGQKAKQYQHMLSGVEAYIVSDGRSKNRGIDGKKVLYLSELETEDGIGIVVCLDEGNQEQVIPMLEKRKFHYLCI